MRVPLSWLRDFSPFEGDPRALAETLDDLGLVVEEIEHVGEGLADVVVARVLEITAIAGADKIRRVVVDAGGEPLDVVCGAWNFSPGDVVAFAPVGAVLPGDFEISRRKMKGVTSNGMLCSGRELKLSDDHEGILILGEDAAVGERLVEVLGIETDVVFDIAVEANRPDAWSMAGVARDLAARLRLPFAIPTVVPPSPVGAAVADLAAVTVLDDDLCPRFTARVFSGVEVQGSPRWLARRLTLAGMRPINNVVDASNYVMLELGQPTHPYDLDQVPGAALRVRGARPGETVVTLDGIERPLGARSVAAGDDRRDCVICDGNDVPIGVGGVMGGVVGEISPTTTNVLLEAAYFTPMAIARTAKRLGLRTEASARFERGCDPEGIDRAALRLWEVLAPTAGAGAAVADGTLEVRGAVPGAAQVAVRVARVNSVLGTDLNEEEVASYLTPIGFGCRPQSDGVLDVTVPTFRPDTSREIDVIEEVARHHGYANMARRRPASPQVGTLTPYQRQRRLVREVMAGLGAHEAWTPSLLSHEDHHKVGMGDGVELSNPLAPDESVLRQGLLPGLLLALSFNAARRQGRLRLFEVGHVFPPPDAERVARALQGGPETVIDEREMLGAIFALPGDDATTASAAWLTLCDALGVLHVDMVNGPSSSPGPGSHGGGVHPTRRAALVIDADEPGLTVGVVGEVDPDVLDAFGIDGQRQRVGWLEVDLGRLLHSATRRSPMVAPVSKFPSSDVDLAFSVDDAVPAGRVLSVLRNAGGELLESVNLFDVFRGAATTAGTRSLAFRLRFCALDHTLTDEEVGALRARCVDAVGAALGASLRA